MPSCLQLSLGSHTLQKNPSLAPHHQSPYLWNASRTSSNFSVKARCMLLLINAWCATLPLVFRKSPASPHGVQGPTETNHQSSRACHCMQSRDMMIQRYSRVILKHMGICCYVQFTHRREPFVRSSSGVALVVFPVPA